MVFFPMGFPLKRTFCVEIKMRVLYLRKIIKFYCRTILWLMKSFEYIWESCWMVSSIENNTNVIRFCISWNKNSSTANLFYFCTVFNESQLKKLQLKLSIGLIVQKLKSSLKCTSFFSGNWYWNWESIEFQT